MAETSDLKHGVSVVTVTRERPNSLISALKSVMTQCCEHVLEHIVVVDDCSESWTALREWNGRSTLAVMVERQRGQQTGAERLGELRDVGARLARGRWIAYLDDDNWWEPCHLHGLLDLAERSGVEAVHSWMAVVTGRGEAYLEQLFPWARTPYQRRERYKALAAAGVVRPGSNVYRHRSGLVGDLATDSESAGVDVGEWLIATNLARRIGFADTFSTHDYDEMIGEDDKFLSRLFSEGIEARCTNQPTLVYRLSNNGEPASLAWDPPGASEAQCIPETRPQRHS